MISIQAEPLDCAAFLAAMTAATGDAGAIVSFTGIVRSSHSGENVDALWLDHHERLTVAAVAAIDDDARRKFELFDLTIAHRVGRLLPGEPIVFVAASAEHRRAAFDAVDYVMDRLKTDAPFWKRESRGDGEHWIEAREADHTDRARWETTHG